MALYSLGWKGKIGPVEGSRYWHKGISAPSSVAGVDDFKVAAGSGLVSNVAPGVAWQDGVTVVSDIETAVPHPVAPTTGYRIDAVCIKRTWGEGLTSISPYALNPQTGGAPSLVVVNMGTTIAHPPYGTPGIETLQGLKLFRVNAGSAVLAEVSSTDTGDLRAHSERSIFLRSEILPAAPVLGATYITPSGRRHEYRPTIGGGVGFQQVKRTASGTVAKIDVGAHGIIKITHGLGWVPAFMTCMIPVDSASGQHLLPQLVGKASIFLNATDASFILRTDDLARLKTALGRTALNNYDMNYVPYGNDSSGQVGGLLTSYTVTDVHWFAAE